MTEIKNIYCVGRNYVAHAKELNNEVPTSPFLFSKPTHAFTEAKGQVVSLPGNRGSVHFETEIVVRMGRAYEPGITVDQIVESMGIGIDFTLRDVQNDIKKKGQPWLLAKGFKNSAVVSPLIPFPGLEDLKKKNFALHRNGEKVQEGNSVNMIFDLQTIIDFTAENFGLGEGDLIFTGTPEGVAQVLDNDRLSLLWGDQVIGECVIKLIN